MAMIFSKDIFFNKKRDKIIYSITTLGDYENFLNWNLTPFEVPIMSHEFLPIGRIGSIYFPKDRLDGFFLLPAKCIISSEQVNDCFMDISFPERNENSCYYLVNDKIIKELPYKKGVEVIPSIAIDAFGNYELFYSRVNPEIGISVLRKGLAIAKRKREIARDLGYILRDEKRRKEAIEAFSIVIQEDPNDVNSLIERAQLLDALNRLEEANKEWSFIEKKWGEQLVKNRRLI